MNDLQTGFNSNLLSHPVSPLRFCQAPHVGGSSADPPLLKSEISFKGHASNYNKSNGLPCPEWKNSLLLIDRFVRYSKKRLRPNERLCTCGGKLNSLYVITAGSFKVESLSLDGRVRSSDILLDGDWLGLDAISSGYYTFITTSIDFGEVWAVEYRTLLHEMAGNEELLTHMLKIFSKRLERSSDQLMSITSRSAIGKVSDFLLRIGSDLREHGRRSDVITMPISRNEIADHLGVRVESVSRSFSKLEKLGLIAFNDNSHRQISVPDWKGIEEFVQQVNESNDSKFGDV